MISLLVVAKSQSKRLQILRYIVSLTPTMFACKIATGE